jgi:ferredoxin, 2Fe-2S
MPKIRFIGIDGETAEVDAVEGASVMMAARDAGIRGIEAECGGALSCGTCHVYVAQPYQAMLPQASAEEQDMLEFVAAQREAGSRLSCQISMTADLDGLTVRIPDSQS